MRVKNKFIIGFTLLFSVFLIWYLFIKENDYTISFTVKAATGTVFQGINEWSTIRLEKEKEIYKTIDSKNFDFIQQRMTK